MEVEKVEVLGHVSGVFAQIDNIVRLQAGGPGKEILQACNAMMLKSTERCMVRFKPYVIENLYKEISKCIIFTVINT